jgi:hypothetical protein
LFLCQWKRQRRFGKRLRILNASNRPRDNLSGAERRALRSLLTNADLTVIHADKGNATVVLNTTDYNEKISALLRPPTYRRLAKDPTDAVERKTNLLLKKSSLPEEVIQQLRPQGSLDHRDCMGSLRSTRKVSFCGPF